MSLKLNVGMSGGPSSRADEHKEIFTPVSSDEFNEMGYKYTDTAPETKTGHIHA